MPRGLIPEELTADERKQLEEWGERNGYSRAQCRWAEQTVLDYCAANGKAYVNYVAAIRNAMRSGSDWGLRGFNASFEAAFNRRENLLREAMAMKHDLMKRGIAWSRALSRFVPVKELPEEPGEGRGPTMAEVRAAHAAHCGPKLEVVK